MKQKQMNKLLVRVDRRLAQLGEGQERQRERDERIEKALDDIRRLLISYRACQTEHPRLAITQVQAAKLIASACERAGLPQHCALSRRTLQRMEARKAPARANYREAVRLTETTFLAWLRDYVSGEKSRLDPNRAVSYNEELASHQG